MKLTDLNPRWMVEHPGRQGVGIIFDCPCGCRDEYIDDNARGPTRVHVPFKVALDGTASGWAEKGWDRSGDTFETLTLHPSIWFNQGRPGGWHGWIRNGEIVNA